MMVLIFNQIEFKVGENCDSQHSGIANLFSNRSQISSHAFFSHFLVDTPGFLTLMKIKEGIFSIFFLCLVLIYLAQTLAIINEDNDYGRYCAQGAKEKATSLNLNISFEFVSLVIHSLFHFHSF